MRVNQGLIQMSDRYEYVLKRFKFRKLQEGFRTELIEKGLPDNKINILSLETSDQINRRSWELYLSSVNSHKTSSIVILANELETINSLVPKSDEYLYIVFRYADQFGVLKLKSLDLNEFAAAILPLYIEEVIIVNVTFDHLLEFDILDEQNGEPCKLEIKVLGEDWYQHLKSIIHKN